MRIILCISIYFTRFPNLLPFLWEQLKYHVDRRSGSVFPLLVVAAVVGEFSFSDSSSQTAYFRRAFPTILPWVLASNVMVGGYGNAMIFSVFLCFLGSNDGLNSRDHCVRGCQIPYFVPMPNNSKICEI